MTCSECGDTRMVRMTNGRDLFGEPCPVCADPVRYDRFLSSKRRMAQSTGFEPGEIHPRLFPFQRDIVRWACKRGRAAIFADTGLGKTAQQLEWARHVVRHSGKSVLILAPLAVAQQTVAEGELLGLDVHLCKDAPDVRAGINITNYDRLHKFSPQDFAGIVLDESSILKSQDGKTRTALIESFERTPYRLACTATPAPNDTMELGNHSEFLGVLPRVEMLATYFTHDGGETQKWRLKGHAERDFWRWVASWGVILGSPADLGYDAAGYALPALRTHEHIVESESKPDGALFALEAQGLMERRAARRDSIAIRADRVREIVAQHDGPWIVWCDLNAEADAITAAIPGAVEIRGSDSIEAKEARLIAFSRGEIGVLVSKPSICGFGLNWQHCSRMVFAGLSDSWEQFYQAIRRCWRFGQPSPVDVHLVVSTAEMAVLNNIKRKESQARRMSEAMRREAALGFAETQHRSATQYDSMKGAVDTPQWLRAS